MTIIRTLILFISLWPLTAVAPPTRSPPSLRLLAARDACYRQERIGSAQRIALEHQQYDNSPAVRGYVHCFWTELQLWNDNVGFDAVHIVDVFGGPRNLNSEQAMYAIGRCNQQAKRANNREWCYNAFACVLRSSVGTWYRRHMQDVINGNA